MQIFGRRYDTGLPVRVEIQGDRIGRITSVPTAAEQEAWPFLAPGFFDLQINGYGGTWYCDPGLTPELVRASLTPHFARGVTRLCPTLITAGHEELASGFAAIRAACEQEAWVAAMIPGCHLEGPFISREDGPRGAHPLQHVRPADWDEFCRLQEHSGGRIILVTVAAESPGAVEFIRRATASGVTISLGHTGATSEQITAAVDAGARLSTHLGNGAHGTLRRHPNYLWDQLGEPRLWASIITDGHHLPESVIRSIVFAKTPARTILTCDASGWAGCQPGIFERGGAKFELLPNGKIVIAGQEQFLAGSSLCTDTCVLHALRCTGVSLQQAVDMAGLNPALLLGVDPIRLESGARADLIAFHVPNSGSVLDVRLTIAAGQLQYGDPAQLVNAV